LHLHRGRNKKELEKDVLFGARNINPCKKKKNLKTSVIHCPYHCVPEDCMLYRKEILHFLPGHPVIAAKLGDIMKGTSCI